MNVGSTCPECGYRVSVYHTKTPTDSESRVQYFCCANCHSEKTHGKRAVPLTLFPRQAARGKAIRRKAICRRTKIGKRRTLKG